MSKRIFKLFFLSILLFASCSSTSDDKHFVNYIDDFSQYTPLSDAECEEVQSIFFNEYANKISRLTYRSYNEPINTLGSNPYSYETFYKTIDFYSNSMDLYFHYYSTSCNARIR